MIRLARADDESALYAICLRTGASGADASDLYADPDLLGRINVGPYLRLEPDFAFVLEDGNGTAGYVLGTPDTRAFERACEREWWPPLRQRYPLAAYPPDHSDTRLVRLLHDPPSPPDELVATYPAHLHIDLLPRAQGQGNGRRLINTLLERLTAAGAPGVHLGVGASNHRAIAFYHRMGFTEAGPDAVGGILMTRGL